MAGVKMATVTVSSAGTRVRFIAADTAIKRIYVMPDFSNTGSVYVGGSDVASSVMGRRMLPGNFDSFTVDYEEQAGNLSDWYADAETNGNKLHYIAVLVGDG